MDKAQNLSTVIGQMNAVSLNQSTFKGEMVSTMTSLRSTSTEFQLAAAISTMHLSTVSSMQGYTSLLQDLNRQKVALKQ